MIVAVTPSSRSLTSHYSVMRGGPAHHALFGGCTYCRVLSFVAQRGFACFAHFYPFCVCVIYWIFGCSWLFSCFLQLIVRFGGLGWSRSGVFYMGFSGV